MFKGRIDCTTKMILKRTEFSLEGNPVTWYSMGEPWGLHKKTNTVEFHLYEVLEQSNSETEGGIVVARGKGNGELLNG